ncbi:MAG: 4-hydroxy-tetrahydrodipicolinate reductase [Ignavibacteria bacterium]|nr:4-hydroxy-tetrahydrodipicolinate reductase [Ignavibacteria bacterium]
MNVALIGYGNMGKEVEQVARERGVTVVQIFDSENIRSLRITEESLREVDVCIDFSTPHVVLENITAAVDCGKNVVVGTTGWYDRLDTVRKLVERRGTGFLYSPNFSLGMNLFTQMVMDGARLFDRYPEYDVGVHEIHHAAKADSPSGTALALGSVILQAMRRKQELVTGTLRGRITPQQLQISSARLGHVAGTHAVIFDSESDTVELTHTAKNRKGFALGAIVAAEWLKGKKGFFTMRDVIVQ